MLPAEQMSGVAGEPKVFRMQLTNGRDERDANYLDQHKLAVSDVFSHLTLTMSSAGQMLIWRLLTVIPVIYEQFRTMAAAGSRLDSVATCSAGQVQRFTSLGFREFYCYKTSSKAGRLFAES